MIDDLNTFIAGATHLSLLIQPEHVAQVIEAIRGMVEGEFSHQVKDFIEQYRPALEELAR